MGRCFIQIIMGPAGSGKSTFCTTLQQHCANLDHIRRRRIHVANLDPAAETFGYDMAFDIRDLITVEDVMEELGLGPNGALIYCMEFLLENMDWLEDELNSFDDDELLLLDCEYTLSFTCMDIYSFYIFWEDIFISAFIYHPCGN